MSKMSPRPVSQALWIVFSLCLFGAVSAASDKVIVTEATTVYSAPNVENMTSFSLRPGQSVEVDSRATSDGFRKVYIPGLKALKSGYVLDVDYRRWVDETNESPFRPRRRWSLWAGPVYSYLYESSRETSTSLGASYAISSFSGGTLFYALGVQYQINPQWSVLLGFVNRTVDISGSATEQDTQTSTSYKVGQSFIGAKASVRYRPEDSNHWEIEGQAEYSSGESVTLTTVNGPQFPADAVKVGTYFLLLAGAVDHIKISPHWSFDPRLLAGGVISTNPVIFDGEVEGDLKYSF
jgi:hypothetical protein